MKLNDSFGFIEKQILYERHFVPCRASIFERYRNMIPTGAVARNNADNLAISQAEIKDTVVSVALVACISALFNPGPFDLWKRFSFHFRYPPT